MNTTTAKALALRVSVKLGADEQEALQFIWLGCVEGALRPMYEDGEPFPVHVPTEEMEPVVDLWGRRLPRGYAVVKNLATTFEDFEQVSHVLRFQARDADDFLAYLDARAIERAALVSPASPAAAPEPGAESAQVVKVPGKLFRGKSPKQAKDAMIGAGCPLEVVARVLRDHMRGRGHGGGVSWREIGELLSGDESKDRGTFEDDAKGLYARAPGIEVT